MRELSRRLYLFKIDEGRKGGGGGECGEEALAHLSLLEEKMDW